MDSENIEIAGNQSQIPIAIECDNEMPRSNYFSLFIHKRRPTHPTLFCISKL